MKLRTRITDLLGSKKIRSTILASVACLSWVTGSGLPEAVLTDGQGVIASSSVQEAYAADPATGWATAPAATTAKTAGAADGSTGAATAVNGLIEVVMMIFLPATILAGWLLSPDWTFGEIFGLRPIIHNLWVLVSNIVYVIFAFLLIAMAFMNIFGQWGDHYAMKKALPRFITGILIVPFTWFIVSGTLSITNLLTASILRLPADMMDSTSTSGTDGKKNEITFNMPKKCTLSFDKLASWSSGSTTSGTEKPSAAAGKFFECKDVDGKNELSMKDALAADRGAYGILNLYAYDIFKVGDIKKLDGVNLKSLGSIVDMVLMVGLWGIFLIVYALLVIALVFALFTRAFYLWVIAIFSPLFGLFYYLEGKGKLAESLKNLSFTSFLSLALVPVYVSAALGFGLLFVKMAESAVINPQNSTFFSEKTASDPGKEGSMNFVMGPKGKETTVEVTGFPIGQATKDNAAKAGDAGKGTVKLASSALGKIIVEILAIVVLWMAVMVALKSSEITAEAVKPIADFGSSMGKLAMDMPKYMPIPLGKDKDGKERKLSMAGLWSMGQGISGAISSAAISQGSSMGQAFGQGVAESMGMAANKNVLALQRIAEQLKNTSDATNVLGLAKDVIKNTGASDLTKLATNMPQEKTEMVKAFSSIREEVFRDKDAAKKAIEEIKTSSNPTALRDALQKLFLQLPGYHGNGTEFEPMLKGSGVPQSGTSQTTVTPTVSQDKKSVSVNNFTVTLSEAGKIKQADFDKLATDANITDKADLKTKLHAAWIEVV